MPIGQKSIGIIKQPPTPLFEPQSKDALTTQFGAYSDRLECEPCVFLNTVSLSDEEYSLTNEG